MNTQDFYMELLAKVMADENDGPLKSQLNQSYRETMALKSYQMLSDIRQVLENDDLSDFVCIDEIIDIFYKNGVRIFDRHDY